MTAQIEKVCGRVKKEGFRNNFVDPLPAHCCRSRPPQNAAELPVEAVIRAGHSIKLLRWRVDSIGNGLSAGLALFSTLSSLSERQLV